MNGKVKVSFLVSTAYKGPRNPGDVVEVESDYAERWAKNGIARIVVDEPVKVSKAAVETVKDDIVVDDVVPEQETGVSGAVDYTGLTVKQLYEECLSKHIDVEPKLKREHYLSLLLAHGASEE